MELYNFCLLILLIVLSLCALASLVYIVLAKHFEDRVVGANLVSSIVLNIIALLSVYLEVTFIIDVALVYAFLGFLAVIVLCRLLALQVVEKGLGEGKSYQKHYDKKEDVTNEHF